MKKTLFLLPVIVLTIASPAFASTRTTPVIADKLDDKMPAIDLPIPEPIRSPEPKPTLKLKTEVLPTPDIKPDNHGYYVSTIAKQHLGGASVSAVAKSDIGKKRESTKSATMSTWRRDRGSYESSEEATISAKFKANKARFLIDRLDVVVDRLNQLIKSLKNLL